MAQQAALRVVFPTPKLMEERLGKCLYVEEILVLPQRSNVSVGTSNNTVRVLGVSYFCVEALLLSLRGDKIKSLVHVRDSRRLYAEEI